MYAYIYIYIYSLSLLNLPPNSQPFLPLYVLTELQAGFPVLYTSLPLAIYFTLVKYIHVKITLSTHPTRSSHSVSSNPFSMSVSPFLL